LHVSVVILLAVLAIVFFLLRYTVLGRSLYAVGGNPVAARRMGINVEAVEMFAYCTGGLLSGLAGFMAASMLRLANPQTLVGSELDVIAAVVIGGAAITGGKGSVLGVFLGVALIVVTNNSLILIDVPATWQKIAIAGLLLAAIGLPLLAQRKWRLPSMSGAQAAETSLSGSTSE
jgi:simple sugar transport system permease protein